MTEPTLNMAKEVLIKKAVEQRPHIWAEHEGELYLKFDSIVMFWHTEHKCMVVQYQLEGKAHLTKELRGVPMMPGEIVFGDMIGQVRIEVTPKSNANTAG